MKNNKNTVNSNQGQARLQRFERSDCGQALVTLLFFTMVGMSIAIAAVIVSLSSIISSGKFQSGSLTFMQAESGAENAYLRLLRNPNYKGETMIIGSATVTITVSGINPITITSKASSGQFLRTVRITLQSINGKYSVQSWKEVF